jgi:hypothetical protein
MILKVKIKFRDDNEQVYDCVDFPAFGDRFITLYLEGFVRRTIASEAVFSIETKFVDK